MRALQLQSATCSWLGRRSEMTFWQRKSEPSRLPRSVTAQRAIPVAPRHCVTPLATDWAVSWQVNRRIDYRRLNGQLEALARRTAVLETSMTEEHELSVTTLNAILQQSRKHKHSRRSSTPATRRGEPAQPGAMRRGDSPHTVPATPGTRPGSARRRGTSGRASGETSGPSGAPLNRQGALNGTLGQASSRGRPGYGAPSGVGDGQSVAASDYEF